jgi:O-antigen/teichoic acid export membrane protein
MPPADQFDIPTAIPSDMLVLNSDSAVERSGPESDAGIGHRALSGSVWMIGATGAAKALGFACQLALAWFLTKKEYGIYAIAISLSVFLSILRDGGLPMVLEQKGRHFDLFAGPVFWMMLAINAGTAILIFLIAQPAAQLYHIPELSGVIDLFALTIPLSVLPSVLSVRLAVNLKFRELGIIQVISATTRNALLLYFASSGYGARSLLLPLLITNVTDTLLLWSVTRYSPWSMPPRFRLWPELFESGRWVLLGTFAIGLGNNGSYFLLGQFLPSEIVGTYFFAFQIVVQLGVLLSDNVYQVLVPSLTRMNQELARIRSAVPRALNVVVLVGAVASLSIAAVYEPLERALWHGKWAAAAGAVYIMAIVWPAAAGISVLRALQMATGRFRQWGLVTLLSAVVSVVGTAAGAYLGGSATSAAIGFGLGALLGAALNAAVVLPGVAVRPLEIAMALLRPWLIIGAAATAALVARHFVSNAWLGIAVSGLCFYALVFLGLKVFANDSFALVTDSLRKAIRGKFLPAPPIPSESV